jgi:hypothetical protein
MFRAAKILGFTVSEKICPFEMGVQPFKAKDKLKKRSLIAELVCLALPNTVEHQD